MKKVRSIEEIPEVWRENVIESCQDFEVDLENCFLYSNVASNGESFHLVHPDSSYSTGTFLVATWNAYGFHFCHRKHLERNTMKDTSLMRDPLY